MMRNNKSSQLIPFLLLFCSIFFNPQGYAALDNKGTDFILQWLPNYQGGETTELHLTAEVTTDVTVQYPVNAPTFSQTVTVVPGVVSIVAIPTSVTSWTADNVANNNVHAFADKEFVAYVINRVPFTSDAALGLPVDTFNTEYIVSNWDGGALGSGAFGVYASNDNTTVTITPTQNLAGGRTAGVPFSVTLNKGEGYYGEANNGSGSASNLTGTLIEATRPVGMINGNKCTNVPVNTSYCDHIFEIAQPVQTWGKNILISNLPKRATTFYEVVASEDNTSILQNGISIGTLNRGQYIQFSSGTDDSIIADKPIYVTQYMPGSQYPGSNNIGDPAMANMIPYEQYLNNYTFSTVGGSQFIENYLTLVVPNSEIGSVLFDGALVPAASYSNIGFTNFSVARLPLSQGTHTTSGGTGHGITVEGYNDDDSYTYPGGARFEFINPVGDANVPICTIQTNPGTPPSVSGTVVDNRPSEDVNNNGILDLGEDLNGNGQIDKDTGVFFVELMGASNLTLTTNSFIPGDSSASFTVNLTNPTLSGSGTISGKDGAGNICSKTINLNVSSASCDANKDGKIASDDLTIIKAANRTVNPAYDIDGDGKVTLNDVRKCTLQCTNANCSL